MRAEHRAQCSIVVHVLVAAGVDHQAMCLPIDEVSNQSSHAPLASWLVVTTPCGRIDVNFDGKTGERVGKCPAAVRLLLLEMQLALAREKKSAHRLAKLANARRLNDRGRDQVMPVAGGLVDERVSGHPAILP